MFREGRYSLEDVGDGFGEKDCGIIQGMNKIPERFEAEIRERRWKMP